MQKFILKSKNKISIISLFLIIIAFSSKFIFKNEPVTTIAFIIASIIGVIPILIQAYQALRVKVISIDVLVTIAVIGAFIIKNYEESAIVTFLFLFGSLLEQRTLNKTRSAIKSLTEMAPDVALKKIDDQYLEVAIEEVSPNDILLVKTGAKIPVDGYVLNGNGYINEASITGESKLVNKTKEDNVYAGTILENGTITIVASKVGEETTFGKIIELVEEAQDSKSKTEKFIDSFSKYYTPIVLLIGIIVYIVLRDVEIAITVLVLGCPGALVIGIPVSNVAGIGNGAKNGVLLKGSETISDFSKVDVILFDKTGTLTIGKPEVAELKLYTNETERVLSYLKSIEKESDHPLALAIVNYIDIETNEKVINTNVIKGYGLSAEINGNQILIGNKALLENNNVTISNEILNDVNDLANNGNSIVLMAINKEVMVLLGIKDKVRLGIKEELTKMKKLGVKELIVLSGDNQATVDLVSKELGLTKGIGNLLPEDKQAYVKKLQNEGKIVAFVGDGINDSPALATANIGIAMGSGTDVAIETSDVVLIDANFNKLTHSLGLSKKIYHNMIQNIFIALLVVIVLLISLLASNWMNMTIGMLVHELSILVVILNGMRLLNYK
ncbi:MAG TPA: heavy metal translocating P-type ATPase [Acholeplasmataceae bacterium]|nr:heavy metal translocating P-type ATPase [Acholeplasmataceae bacterium]